MHFMQCISGIYTGHTSLVKYFVQLQYTKELRLHNYSWHFVSLVNTEQISSQPSLRNYYFPS